MNASALDTAAPALCHPRSVSLLAEAAAWRLLGLLFQAPSASWREELAALANEVHDTELRSAASAAAEQASEGSYHTLFGPGGPVSLREVSHRPTVDVGQFIAGLVQLYGAFGYHPADTEPPDHLAVEAGFVAYLRLKEAYALEQDHAQQAAVAARCAEQFVAEHLAPLIEPLVRRLAEASIPYLAQTAAALARYASAPNP